MKTACSRNQQLYMGFKTLFHLVHAGPDERSQQI